MKNRPQLFFALLVAAAVLTAACVSDPKNGDPGVAGSPTPTPTASPTPTVVPTPTPLPAAINVAQHWVSPDGKQMFFRFQSGFTGSIRNLRTFTTAPTGCDVNQQNVAIVVTNFGFSTVVFNSNGAIANSITNCAVGLHHFDVDYVTPAGSCTGASCINETIFDSTANGTFFDTGVFGTMTAQAGNDTGYLRITIPNPLQTGDIVNLTEFYLYNATGNLIPNGYCAFQVTLAPSVVTTPIEPCAGNPLSAAGNYKIYLRGTFADTGLDYAQYATFAYAP